MSATLKIIIGSTRPGRSGGPVAEWFHELAARHGGFDADLVDLAEVGLPLFNEPENPSRGRYSREHTKRWGQIIAAGDAFVFVVPEYNHGYNAATKNALDYLHAEWRNKPVGFVSYGGISAGRAGGGDAHPGGDLARHDPGGDLRQHPPHPADDHSRGHVQRQPDPGGQRHGDAGRAGALDRGPQVRPSVTGQGKDQRAMRTEVAIIGACRPGCCCRTCSPGRASSR